MTRRPGTAGDDGFSLAEILVGMAVMAIFTVGVTGGLISALGVLNRAEAETTTQTEISNVFLSLDREVRYATGISAPAAVQGNWYVEYLLQDGTRPVCVQLRVPVGGGSLQQRTWPEGETVPVFTSRIQHVAPVVENGVAVPPFTRTVAAGDQDFQRLRLYLGADGSGLAGTSSPLDVTFTAANTSSTTVSDTSCTDARGVNP